MRILYIAQCGLPDTAPGIRIYNIAKMLRILGHEVVFLCREFNENGEILYSGFRYLFDASASSKSSVVKRIKHGIDSVFAFRTLERIKNEIKANHYDALIIYNDSSGITKHLLRLKKDGLKIYGDVTEWYSYNHQNGLLGNYYAFKTTMRIRFTDKKLSGVIAISPFLLKYYKKRGVNVIEIPPFIDHIDSEISERLNENTVSLIYCGSPSSKDLLKETLQAVSKINQAREIVQFVLIGIDDAECNKMLGDCKKIGIHALGRLPHDKVYQYYRNADFSILFRKSERYAKAGYSTKFVESLCLGVPVICNKVGGADEEICNDSNGFKLEKYSLDSIYNLLSYISGLDKEKINQMKRNALYFASDRYACDMYIKTLQSFLHD